MSAGLSIFLLLALPACAPKEENPYGGTWEEETAVADSRSTEEKAKELLPRDLVKVGFAQAGHESDWRIAATKSCMDAFSEENGYQLYFVDADNDPKVQVAAVREFIREKADYIIIDPILTAEWTAVLKEAYHAKIPVILLNQTVECDDRYYIAWFGPDFVREGEYAGQWLQNYLREQGRWLEQIRIVAVNGTEGTNAQLGRTEGFGRYLERNQNWTLLAQDSGDFTESGGRMVMEGYLERFADLDVVICQNDNEALGACAALDEAGISYGKDGDVIVISFDATKAGLKAVLDGKINADFECSPFAPSYAKRAIQTLGAGQPLTQKHHDLRGECFASDEEPMMLVTGSWTKRMVTVTKELIKERIY